MEKSTFKSNPSTGTDEEQEVDDQDECCELRVGRFRLNGAGEGLMIFP